MEQKRVNHLEQIPPEDWGKTPTPCQETGGRDGAANRTTGKETSRSPDSDSTAPPKKSIGHQKTRHHHRRVTHQEAKKSHQRQKAVKNEGVNQAIKDIAGIYTQ